MRTLLFSILFLGFAWQPNAQTIEKFSIDSGGAALSVGNIQIVYTIGEVVIQEYSSGNVAVSEGFISENLLQFSLSNDDFVDTFFEISLYPNPVIDYFQISGLKEKTNLVIYDSMGKEVLRKNQYLNEKIDIENFYTGVYLVKLGASNVVKKIIKN